MPATLKEFFKLLPRLEEICYEPWREWCEGDQCNIDMSSKEPFELLIPNPLRRMVVFEDFNDDYAYWYRRIYQYDIEHVEPLRTAVYYFSRALAEASLAFKHLSASFIVEAKQFFHACQPTWVWGNCGSELEPHTVRSWEAVALNRGRHEFQVVKELLDADVAAKSHGDAIHHLKLSHQVARPVSLWQIQKEIDH